MKTYEGTFTIKWFQNDSGDRRPLTIHCENRKALKQELARITNQFNQFGDSPNYPLHRKENIGKTPFSIRFDINERK